MKKFIIIFTLLLLFGCSPKREDFYNLKVGESLFVVGFDDYIEDNNFINDYSFFEDEKGNKKLNYIEMYIDDTNGEAIFIDDYKLKESISNTCSDLNGDLVEKNGHACVLHKAIKNNENIITISGDILDDNLDKIDRITIKYDYVENE